MNYAMLSVMQKIIIFMICINKMLWGNGGIRKYLF